MNRNYRRLTRNASLLASVESELISELISPKNNKQRSADEYDNIAIVGGELFNKGAQAMTFTVVDQMSKQFPEKDIYLLSGRDYERSPDEKSQYTFDILPWGLEIQLALYQNNLDILNSTDYSRQAIKKVKKTLSESHSLIDINGYTLSSQQGFDLSFRYINNIIISKMFGIPMYVLPQSIGPFDYSTLEKVLLNPLLRTYLPYPEIICPRETAGVESLAPYTRNNVQHEFDIVLQNQEYDLTNIYTTIPDLKQIETDPNSVGIVPNSKVFERIDSTELYTLYEETIKSLLSKGRTVYILRHSTEDLEYCESIESRFEDNDDVILVGGELNAIELEYLINQFDFMIGSRYHSLIHAYKNAVPVLAIGWATKYRELLNEFNQSNYFFEGRNKIEVKKFLEATSLMHSRHSKESDIITKRRKEILEKSIFDSIFE